MTEQTTSQAPADPMLAMIQKTVNEKAEALNAKVP
jgi:hypothetical protein